MNSPLRGDMSVLDDGVVEVPVEALLDVGHILDLGDAAHRDLLPLVLVRDRGAHSASLLRLYLKISHRQLKYFSFFFKYFSGALILPHYYGFI